MAGTNNFKIFNQNKQNMVDDVTYQNSDYRQNGARQGIAPSNIHNKIFYQASIMAAALAQAMANKNFNVSDSNFNNLVAVLENMAIQSDFDSYLPLSGGTIDEGETITLGRDPTSDMEAVTRRYVDNFMPPGARFTSYSPIVPSGFLFCDGSAVSRTTYSRLFSAIGTIYGPGDGSTTFNLPDERDRSSLTKGSTFPTLGQKGGEINHTLTLQELPTIEYLSKFNFQYEGGDPDRSREMYNAVSPGTLGGGQPHNNMPPYIVVNTYIKY